MTNTGFSRVALFTLDRLTDVFPSTLPRWFHKLFLLLLGNPWSLAWCWRRYRRALRRGVSFERIAIIADLGIGDALLLESAARIMRGFFPDAVLDYFCNPAAAEILPPLEGASHIFALPGAEDRPRARDRTIARAIALGHYTLVLNFCPFLSRKIWHPGGVVVNLYIPFAAYILSLWRRNRGPMHIAPAVQSFLQEFFSPFVKVSPFAVRGQVPDGSLPAVHLSDRAIQEARLFLLRHALIGADRLVIFKTDATSPYTRIPLDLQRDTLRVLTESEEVHAILLSDGEDSQQGARLLLEGLPGARKVIHVPMLPLPVFAALIDFCDCYLGGDGGALHLAAAWKISATGKSVLRNRTLVVSLFGATESRMYGYDSARGDHLRASQMAPSRVFLSGAPCRNATCVNKTGKTCRQVRCFAGITAEPVAGFILAHLRTLARLAELDVESG